MADIRQSTPDCGTYKTVKAIFWHIQDSQSQILALGCRFKYLNSFQFSPLRSEAGPHPPPARCRLPKGLIKQRIIKRVKQISRIVEQIFKGVQRVCLDFSLNSINIFLSQSPHYGHETSPMVTSQALITSVTAPTPFIAVRNARRGVGAGGVPC